MVEHMLTHGQIFLLYHDTQGIRHWSCNIDDLLVGVGKIVHKFDHTNLLESVEFSFLSLLINHAKDVLRPFSLL